MATKTILVTGASGNVGSRVVQGLCERNLAVRALVRPQAATRFPQKVEVARGDFEDPASLAKALEGVEAVYLLSTGTHLAQYEARLVDLARAAEVRHVVKHSVLGAEYEGSSIRRWHRAAEKHLEASGLAFTHLRAAPFTSNALGWAGTVKAQRTVYGALANSSLPVVDPDDLAAAAVAVLQAPAAHAGKAYALTGPEALTTAQQVKQLGEALGTPLTYVDVPDTAARDAMLSMGMEQGWVAAMVELLGLLRSLQSVAATADVSQLTGRAPRRFAEWAQKNVAAFR